MADELNNGTLGKGKAKRRVRRQGGRETSPSVRVWVDTATIAAACRRDSGKCMIAEAIREAYPTALRISVDLRTMRFTLPEEGKRYVYLTPPGAGQRLVDFDQGKEVLPFAFVLQQAIQVLPSVPGVDRDRRSAAQKLQMSLPLTEAERCAREVYSAARRKPTLSKFHKAHGFPVLEGGRPLPHSVLLGRYRFYGAKLLRP